MMNYFFLGKYPRVCQLHHSSCCNLQTCKGYTHLTVYATDKCVEEHWVPRWTPGGHYIGPASTWTQSCWQQLLWLQPSNQYFIHPIVQSSNPSLTNLESRMSCETVSHAFHKSMWLISVTLPLSTNPVTLTGTVTEFIRCDLPLGKPCWLSLIISLFSMCLSIISRRICSMMLLGTEVRLTGL